MTPSHYPDDDGNVQVVGATDRRTLDFYIDTRSEERRTDQQKHTDQALDAAEQSVATAIEETEQAIAWLRSIGAQLPTRLETLPVVLRQLADFTDDERGRRG